MDDSGPKTGAMTSNGSARSPGRGGSRGRGGGFRGDRGGRGRGNFRGGMRGRGNFRGGDRSGSRGRGKFSSNSRGSVRGSFQGNESGSVSFRGGDRSSVGERGGFRGADRNSFRGRGNFRGGDKSPFRGRGNFRGGDKSQFRGRGRGNFRGGDRGRKGRGGFTQRKSELSESEQEGTDSEQEDTDSEQGGTENQNTVEMTNGDSVMNREGSVVKPKNPKKANKKKPAKEKEERVRLPHLQLLPGQAKKAVQFSNLPSLFNKLDEELKKLAETVGPVELLTYNMYTHPKGCFITAICVFEDKEHVSKAIEKLHGHEFRGNHLLVERTSPKNSIRLDKNSICVSNLAENTTEEDLWKLFKDCGRIRMIEMRRECTSLVPETPGLARIYFQDSDSVARATALSNSQLLGSTIKVFALSCDLVVYVKNFALQTKYKTIKDFMTAVNAVYYCFVYLKSFHMKEKLKGLFIYFPDQENYNKVVSMENFEEIPVKMQKLMGCTGCLSFGKKQIFKNASENNLKATEEEECLDEDDSDAAVEKADTIKKSKKKQKLTKVLPNGADQEDEVSMSAQQIPKKKRKIVKDLKTTRKRKGSERSNNSPIKKNKNAV